MRSVIYSCNASRCNNAYKIFASDWMPKPIGCLAEPAVPFSVFLGISGREGNETVVKGANFQTLSEFTTIKLK